MMNFIPFNAVEGLAYRRPARARAAMMAGVLHQQGIVARLRDSAGQDSTPAAASCGPGMPLHEPHSGPARIQNRLVKR